MARRSIALLLVGTTVLPAFAPAALAHGHRGYYGPTRHHDRNHHHHDGWGALAFGLTAFALGAAIAAPRHRVVEVYEPPCYAPPPPPTYYPAPAYYPPPAPVYAPAPNYAPAPTYAPAYPTTPVAEAPQYAPQYAPQSEGYAPSAPACAPTQPTTCRYEPQPAPCRTEDVETPIFEERSIPVYEDRQIPITEMVVTPIVGRRPDRTGCMCETVIGERRTPRVVGMRVERVKVGERMVAVRTGTRVERRVVGAMLAPSCGCDARAQNVPVRGEEPIRLEESAPAPLPPEPPVPTTAPDYAPSR